jgi:Uncharacterized conserved protein, contains double-stranded beta-helix domain
MKEIKQAKIDEIAGKHKCQHDGYEYYKKEFVSREDANQCMVSIYEIPPGKSAYPYHYHTKNEEVFYIISGSGVLSSPAETKNITAGDLLFFPANEKGAHKLTNNSSTEKLIYLDFDTCNDIDVTFYPDSKKMGVWGMGINQVFKIDESVDYYKDE